MGRGDGVSRSHIGDDVRNEASMGEWSLLVAPAVLGSVSLFVAILARLESRLLE